MTDSGQKEQDLLKKIKRQLDESAVSLDADTLRELRLARSKAIESLHKPRQLWQPVGAFALVATVAAVAISLQLRVTQVSESLPSVEDIQLLSASEELELYEDLEFYQWLELERRTVKG